MGVASIAPLIHHITAPGPLVALIGAGIPVMLVAFPRALGGTWTYGRLWPQLPH